MDTAFVIPVTFWSNSQPCFRISSVCVTPNLEKLVTGSFSGQLCLWDLDIKNGHLTPKNILIGHQDSITCMVSTNEFVISSCESKQILRWNLNDGYSSKKNQTSHIHRKLALFSRPNCDEYVIACGDYSEICIIHPFTLQVIFLLNSTTNQDWISSFQIKYESTHNLICGITASGCAKFWTFDKFTNETQLETKSEIIPMKEIIDVKYSSDQDKLLFVSIICFSVYKFDLSTCLCKIDVSKGEKCLGGNFLENNVMIWTKSGKFYLYDISEKQNLISIFLDEYALFSVFEPAFDFVQSDNDRYFIRGDFWGKINILKINKQENKFQHLISTSLAEKWVNDAFFNSYVKDSEVTCCIYVSELDKFFIGCHNGCIVSIPATQSIMSFYFYLSNSILIDTFVGQNGKINCLLYPHQKYVHFNKSHLVSGSSDFSVCLWDIFKVELLYKFCVQSGEILRLIIPPQNSSTQVKFSICSVSLDNSVAILNLKDQRCVILTSRHTFPVIGVHWRPLDDFIIVECFDGTVYVWQIETGHLDRVIDGVMAQEVVYACDDYSTTVLYNFYIHENHFKRNTINNFYTSDKNIKNSVMLSRFFVGNSQCHIFSIDLVPLFEEIDCNLETSALKWYKIPEIYLLTQAMSAELQKKYQFDKLTKDFNITQEFELSKNNNENLFLEKNKASKRKFLDDLTLKKIRFLLSTVHIWGLNSSLDETLLSKLDFLRPIRCVSFGLISHPGVLSFFLPTEPLTLKKNSTFVTNICVSVVALSKLMKSFVCDQREEEILCWEELISFYEKMCTNMEMFPKVKTEILCKLWQIKCLPIQKIVRKFLHKHIQALTPKEISSLLEFWYKYLPHFKILDKTLSEKVDFENKELKTVALVLFGAVGSDLKFKSSDLLTQENFIYQTCASFVYLLLLPNSQRIHFSDLQTIAVDFIGRGYIVWEQFLKIEKIVPILLKICENALKNKSEPNIDLSKGVLTMDMYFTAQNALKSIAIARTAAFINWLINEVNNIKTGRGDGSMIENAKAEILSVLSHLLERTPYFMLLYLNDVISLLVYCIDFSHLKQENLSNLIPVIKKFRQVHHSVTSQKIAVGLATGSLVLYDLRTGKAVEVPAHKDSVSALKFSDDGKSLVSYSCYENKLSYWQILTGMFGLGQFQVKCTKSCPTYQVHDEEIRNHLEIASLTWTNKKSVLLSLCDGRENIFEF